LQKKIVCTLLDYKLRKYNLPQPVNVLRFFIFIPMIQSKTYKSTGKIFSYLKIVLLVLIYFISFLVSRAQQVNQTDSGLVSYSDSLIQIIQKDPSDSNRIEANKVFSGNLFNALQRPESFTQNFDSLKNVSVKKSNDDKLKIYTWTLAKSDASNYSFHGFLQFKTMKGELKIYPLCDSTSYILKPESERLKTDRWYGCIYYEIIPVKRSGKTYYTLLGWKAMNEKTSQKLIDVLYFDKDTPKFGYPLFKAENVFRNRMIYSFMARLSMVLRYESRKKLIVLDHLSASTDPKSNFESGPDGTYDAFKFRSGRWTLMKDIDIRSTWKPKKNVPKPFGEDNPEK